jgi:polyvinyl alcohol dehydrogenase (cytochrome)
MMNISKMRLSILIALFFIFQKSFSQFEMRNGKGLTAELKAEGKNLFETNCASCHNTNAEVKSNAPNRNIIAAMTARTVFSALVSGKMKVQSENLSESQKRAIAQYITNMVLVETTYSPNAYTKFSIEKNPKILSGWGGNLAGTGFQKNTTITKENIAKLKVKWTFGFPDGTQVRSKPAVMGNCLIVGTQFGEVYAIEKNTGKIGWIYKASAAIRGGIAISQTANGPKIYFTDYATNTYCLSETGKEIWNIRAGIHPQSGTTGTATVYNNTVFVPITSFEVASAADPNFPCCNSSGELVALNATNGKIKWRHKVIAEEAKEQGKKKNGKPYFGPSGGVVWCSPNIDTKRGLIYIGTGENYTDPATTTSDAIQAIDIYTGKLRWNFQATPHDTWNAGCPGNPNCPEKAGPDFDFGMAPILVKTQNGNDILVVGQKSSVVHALEPATGKIIWQKRVGKGGMLGGIHWGMAADGKNVYAAVADNIYAMDKSDSTQKPAPGIYALKLETGEIVWKTPTPVFNAKIVVADDAWKSSRATLVGRVVPANSAAPLVIPGVVFAGALDGFIRAYDTENGKIIWEYDTLIPFETNNGIPSKGGSIDGASPTIIGNMLFLNSGYGLWGEIPGNVLIAFELEK